MVSADSNKYHVRSKVRIQAALLVVLLMASGPNVCFCYNNFPFCC